MANLNFKSTQCKVGGVNCKIKFTFLLVCFFITAFSSRSVAQDKEAYVVVSTDSTTLTFYYDDQKSNRTGAGVHGIDDLDQGIYPKWINVRYYDTYNDPWIENPYTTVVFDASFKDAKPTSCAWWFNYCTKLTEIKGIENLNTANVTVMGYMFNYCSSLTTLDVSKFNTANVTYMYDMFSGCSSLTTLDVSKFNTANVTDMCVMFRDCSGLTNLDVSKFNTENVTDMGGMFYGCRGLTTLDASNFNTENVTDMSVMFSGCSSLTTLDLSKFNTANVTDMSVMFSGCSSLTTLDVSNFNTENVTDMGGMFDGCSGLSIIDVSKFNTANVTDMHYMFRSCSSLTTLDVSNFNTENVTDMEEMFIHCSSLTTLDVSNFNTENVTNMEGVFWGCSGITTLDVSKFNTENVTDMRAMFCDCSSLTTLDVSHFKTDNVTNMSDMFLSCTSLTSLDVSKFDTKNVTDMWRMFNDCDGLLTLDISNFETENVEDMRGMFADCDNLTTIIVSDQWSVNSIPDSYSERDYWYDTPFDNSPQLIGNAGTKYSDENNNSGIAFAHIDGGDSNPGYLTTESYKVFYDFDGDGKVDNINTVDWENNATPPTSFDLKDTPELPISNPISKKGQKFRGWKGTPITELTEDNPQKDIVIPAGAVGNRIYTAMWDEKEAYAVLYGTILTFYYDNQKSSRDGVKYEMNTPGTSTLWHGTDDNPSPITTAVFDQSFDQYYPETCSDWFLWCNNLTEIKDIKYLHTDNAVSLSSMFYNCQSLVSLDVSGFKTDNVEQMYGMFANCSKLTSLDVSKFNTSKVESMAGMFAGCNNLTELNVSGFDTQNVTDMEEMFLSCWSLNSLDVSGFRTDKVENMRLMFNSCNRLTKLDLSSFNTVNVTDMGGMFGSCSSLTDLDLSTFNTEKVTDMREMFRYCSNLTTIIVSDQWKTTNVKTSAADFNNNYYSGPFEDCSNLIGNAGTTYSDDHQDVDYAHIDTESNPGYLTTESYKVFYDLDGGTWADGANSPTSFALDLKNNIQIPTPKKSGMKFVGWTGTLASGLSSETPTKDVQISPDKLGNRIYTAHWEEKDINITIPDKITFPASPLNNEAVCEGSEKSVTLSLALPDDEVVAKYVLSIPNVLDNDIEVTPSADDSELEIVIDIPQDQVPGAYQGSLNLYFLQNDTPKEYHFTVEIAVARNVLLHLYNDVIFVDNHSGLYGKNGSYHWYRNDQEIPNANNQYLSAQNMSGKYKARMLTSDGVTVYSCPIDGGISKKSAVPVKTYPNPAVSGEPFVMAILDYAPETSYTILISNSNGVIVKEISDATEYTTLTLPRGVYSGALISGGTKRGFKLIVNP